MKFRAQVHFMIKVLPRRRCDDLIKVGDQKMVSFSVQHLLSQVMLLVSHIHLDLNFIVRRKGAAQQDLVRFLKRFLSNQISNCSSRVHLLHRHNTYHINHMPSHRFHLKREFLFREHESRGFSDLGQMTITLSCSFPSISNTGFKIIIFQDQHTCSL